MSVLYLTTGQPGSGKTYSRVRWLMREFLPNSTGLYITNLPLNVEKIASELAPKLCKTAEEIAARIHVIPDDEMKRWRSLNDKSRKQELAQMKVDGTFPPVKYLESLDLNNARVAIDEFHRYFHKKDSPTDVLLMWNEWFAEIRKTGCTFEAITQDLDQLPSEFIGKVGLRTDLVPYGSTRDPFLNIPMADYYELRAAYAGIREQKICQAEYRKGTSFTGRVKWVQNHMEKFTISSDYFPYYNSYQRTESTGTKAAVTLPADRYKKLTALWFLRRHFFKLAGRLLIVILFFWLTFGGGVTWAIDKFVVTLTKVSDANRKMKNKPSEKVVPVAPDAVPGVPGAPGAPGAPGVPGVVPVAPPAPDLSGFKPVMFFNDGCYLRSGVFVKPGYTFKGGYHDGKTVVSVDFSARSYDLGGDIVSMY